MLGAVAPRPLYTARDSAPRPGARSRPANRATVSSYTIAHAGRQIRFGPVAFWIAVGSVVVMASWSVVTATYFAFRDDVLKGLLARQAEQQFAYEDRIAELRAQIDRTTSRQLLDQEQFERKLDELVRRQVALESRATALRGFGEPTSTGSIKPALRATGSRTAKPPASRDTSVAPRKLDRGAFLGHYRTPSDAKPGREVALGIALDHVEASLDRVERHQAILLRQMQERYEGKTRQLRSVLAGLGMRLDTQLPAMGGPFVPVKLPADGSGFEHALDRASAAREQAERLSRVLVTIPVRKPISGEIDVSSSFGARMDPFLHIAAMHTGLDFRGDVGDPIRATAAGRVTVAGWSGGYGKMVEIDHGKGLATRYGHLSQISVDVGDKVRVGQIVGRLGSTGRSTGPHLHYETRVDGEAVDPQRFLKAGAKLDDDS